MSEGIRDGKRKPFNLPGGKPEGRETSLEALIRELTEELDLRHDHDLLRQLRTGLYDDLTPTSRKIAFGRLRLHSSILTVDENNLCLDYFGSNVPTTVLRFIAESEGEGKYDRMPILEHVDPVLNIGIVDDMAHEPVSRSRENGKIMIRSAFGAKSEIEWFPQGEYDEEGPMVVKGYEFMSDVYPMWWGRKADYVTDSNPPDMLSKWFSVRDLVSGVIAGKIHPQVLRQVMDFGLMTLGLAEDFQFRILMSMGGHTMRLMTILHKTESHLDAHEMIDILGIAAARYDSRIQVRTLASDRE